ncbi:hypothetical protein RFI_09104 [Reticulomyxa filosa]|uniref:Uncharacterized protein n=1 Tax=Reticulomyxa filosa TaxID=46433 RepID=X6NPT4_RETFI|nr:hypothetical protein RFI_09104 [Reticulomyxa filosa]|eukprot:ETO28026.1 hypothetical protein RFI_09104 [Reticulomyxa filosa]
MKRCNITSCACLYLQIILYNTYSNFNSTKFQLTITYNINLKLNNFYTCCVLCLFCQIKLYQNVNENIVLRGSLDFSFFREENSETKMKTSKKIMLQKKKRKRAFLDTQATAKALLLIKFVKRFFKNYFFSVFISHSEKKAVVIICVSVVNEKKRRFGFLCLDIDSQFKPCQCERTLTMSTTNRKYPNNQNGNKNKRSYRPKNGTNSSDPNNNENDNNTLSENEKDNISGNKTTNPNNVGKKNHPNNNRDSTNLITNPVSGHNNTASSADVTYTLCVCMFVLYTPYGQERRTVERERREKNAYKCTLCSSNYVWCVFLLFFFFIFYSQRGNPSGDNSNKQYRSQPYMRNKKIIKKENQSQQRNYRTAVSSHSDDQQQSHPRRMVETNVAGSLTSSSSSVSPPRSNNKQEENAAYEIYGVSPQMQSFSSNFHHKTSSDGPPPGFNSKNDLSHVELDMANMNEGTYSEQQSDWRNRNKDKDKDANGNRVATRNAKDGSTKYQSKNNTVSTGNAWNRSDKDKSLQKNKANNSTNAMPDPTGGEHPIHEEEDVHIDSAVEPPGIDDNGDESWTDHPQAKAYGTIAKCMRDLIGLAPTDTHSAEKIYMDLVYQWECAEKKIPIEKTSDVTSDTELGHATVSSSDTTTLSKERKYLAKDLLVMGAIFQEVNENSTIPEDVR